MSSHYHGTFVQAPRCGEVEVLLDALVSVDADGVIERVLRPADAGYQQALDQASQDPGVEAAGEAAFFFPGFVDLHVHAPQWPQLGHALHLPLEQWLHQYTFPLEARFADLDFARDVYDELVLSLIANGTTTAVYFGSIHRDATVALAEHCLRHGQRAVVGKVAMDDPQQCPHYYRDESAKASVEGAREVIERIRALPGNGAALVRPAVTPRFIPSCSDEALQGLGLLAEQTGTHIQTHCSESDWEHGHVLERLGRSDTQALADFGLLNRHTVLAHANFVSDHDLTLMARAGAGIAHCPLSNAFFADSVFPLRHALQAGVNVGLGTDISGGPSASMFDSCRHAIVSSRILEAGANPALAASVRGRPDSRVDFRDAFWLATAGGGEALDLPLGKFEPGYLFDAFALDARAPGSNIRLDDTAPGPDLVAHILFVATRANVSRVWTSGVLRYERC